MITSYGQSRSIFLEIPIYHVLTAKVTFGNIHGTDRAVDGVSTIKENSITFCAVDENIFAIPAGYRRPGWLNKFIIHSHFSSLVQDPGEGYHQAMYMDDDALLQMAIERSLLNSEETAASDQVTLYEALGYPHTRVNRTDNSTRYVDYDLQR